MNYVKKKLFCCKQSSMEEHLKIEKLTVDNLNKFNIFFPPYKRSERILSWIKDYSLDN